jgi:hypothetical protein
MRTHEPSNFIVRGRGPGFVIWLSRRNSPVAGFVTWAETGVAELSPTIRDAWRFPTLNAANSKRGKSRGIGMIIRFSRRRESDSLWACRRLRILTV